MSITTLIILVFISWLGAMISHAQKKEALTMAHGALFVIFFVWLMLSLGGNN